MKVVLAIVTVMALVISAPVGFAADFNGDGTNDIAIFRPSTGLWAIRDGARVYFGGSGDEPMPGDYDGDGTVDIAIFRESTGLWAVNGGERTYFGGSGDVPIAGITAGGGGGLWSQNGSHIYYSDSVGIGTSWQSGAPLTVSGSTTAPDSLLLLYEQGGSGDYARLSFQNGEADNSSFIIAGMPKIIDDSARMRFDYVEPGSITTNIMALTGNGCVGIGTADPDERLSVKMGGYTWQDAHFALVDHDSDDKWGFVVGGSNRLYIGYNEVSMLHIQTDGRLVMNGGGYYNPTTGNWVDGSSRTLKQDIKPNEMDIGQILDQVNIVNYRYKKEATADKNAPYHIGFIAEDTPELLSSKDRNGMVTGDCIGLLLAAVKEQQQQISSQRQQIASLREDIERLKR